MILYNLESNFYYFFFMKLFTLALSVTERALFMYISLATC